MGIKVEFNPDLALRSYSEYEAGRRQKEECLPQALEAGMVHGFLKKEQRLYYLEGEVPLVLTKGAGELSRPLASVRIIEATHHVVGHEVWTKGKYSIIEVFPESATIHP